MISCKNDLTLFLDLLSLWLVCYFTNCHSQGRNLFLASHIANLLAELQSDKI